MNEIIKKLIPFTVLLIGSFFITLGIHFFLKSSNNLPTTTPYVPDISEVEQLRKEVEELKRSTAENQKNSTPFISKESRKNLLTLSNKEIIAKISPAVVYIRTETGKGSGMIFSGDGYVLTNAHVVKGVVDVDVSMFTGTTLAGTVIGRDEVADLAVIKIKATEKLPKVEFGDSDNVQQGDNVFAFGFPFGLKSDVSFKDGTISRRIEKYFETSTELHPGNSGGPLVDKYGQVIGVNTAIFGKSIGDIQVGETIKLAIPINDAKKLIPDLMTGKTLILPEQPAQQYMPAPTYDYTPPVITSITAEKPSVNTNAIIVKINLDETSVLSVGFSFKYSPDGNVNDIIGSTSSNDFRQSFSFSVPLPSWNEGTVMNMVVKATDSNGNVGKWENYSVRLALIPGIQDESYTHPYVIK